MWRGNCYFSQKTFFNLSLESSNKPTSKESRQTFLFGWKLVFFLLVGQPQGSVTSFMGFNNIRFVRKNRKDFKIRIGALLSLWILFLYSPKSQLFWYLSLFSDATDANFLWILRSADFSQRTVRCNGFWSIKLIRTLACIPPDVLFLETGTHL